jgi:hypothetical protein
VKKVARMVARSADSMAAESDTPWESRQVAPMAAHLVVSLVDNSAGQSVYQWGQTDEQLAVRSAVAKVAYWDKSLADKLAALWAAY